MKEFYGAGVPVPFDCNNACEVKITDCAKIEKVHHKTFEPNRINANHEFFSIKLEQVIVILELFDRKNITYEITAEIENDLAPEDKAASKKIKKISSTSPVYLLTANGKQLLFLYLSEFITRFFISIEKLPSSICFSNNISFETKVFAKS